MATTKTCPKCGSNYFDVYDYAVRCCVYTVIDGYVTADGECDDDTHIRTKCVCNDCGHEWHPRKLNEDFIIDE